MLQHNSVPTAASLDDDALTRKVVSLARNEREALVDFLHHLGEFDARRLYLGQGYPSLFEYCSGFLRLSNGTAHRRYTTARLMRRFPLIADFLRSGRLNTKRVALLREVLTEQNHAEVLERAAHGAEKDVERLVATLNPKPDITDGIRKLPSARPVPALTRAVPLPAPPATSATAGPPSVSVPADCASLALASPPVETAGPNQQANAAGQHPTAALLPAPRAHRMEVEPTTGTTFAVRMSVGPEFVAEFEEVKAALSHKIPNGNFEAVMRECFRITLEAVKRRRTGTTRERSSAGGSSGTTSTSATPGLAQAASKNANVASASSSTPPMGGSSSDQSESATSKPSRYISATVRQSVWSRDGGCCAFVSKNGRRCGSKYQLEVHHIDPYALGGAATVENLSLRCRQHNRHEAELVFGAGFMQSLPLWKCEDSAAPSPEVPSAIPTIP